MGLIGAAFLLGGLGTAGLGVALTAAPGLHPALGEAAWTLGRLGLAGAHLLIPGAALAAGGVVLLALRGFQRLIGIDRETAEAIDDLTRATSSQADAILQLESLVAALRQETAEAGVVLRDQAALIKQKEENDPLFRLAASLDQLGARFDRGLQATRDFVVAEVHTMHDELAAAPQFDAMPLVDSAVRVERGLMGFGERVAALELYVAEALRMAQTNQAYLDAGHAASGEVQDTYAEERFVGESAHHDAASEFAHEGEQAGTVDHAEFDGARHLDSTSYAADDAEERPLRLAAAESTWRAPAYEPAWQPDWADPRRNGGGARAEEFAPYASEHDPEPMQLRFDVPAPLPSSPARRDHDEHTSRHEAVEDTLDLELDRQLGLDTDGEVSAPLPSARPEGLDLLSRLDSAVPLELRAREQAPPLFPDLDVERG